MSYSDVIAGLTGLSVAGVKRRLDYQPAQVASADLPLLFPSLPRGEHRIATLAGAMEPPTYRLNLVLLIEPVAQNRAEPTWDASIALIDALTEALDSAAVAQGIVGYSTQLAVWQFGTGEAAASYWALLVDVEVQ